jgi:hypothetical protein
MDNPFAPRTFGDSDADSVIDDLLGPPKLLFSREDFRPVIEARLNDMFHEIQEYRANELLNTGAERLVDYFEDKYAIDFPRLDEQNSSISHGEVKLSVTNPPAGEPETVTGTRYTIRLPFTGDARVFNSRPTINSAWQPPIARIEAAELIFTYYQVAHDPAVLAASYDQDLARLKQYLGWLINDAKDFNSRIRTRAAAEIQARRTKLLNDQGVAASLGIRLERTGLSATYAAPQVQRRPRVVRPKSSAGPYVAEPALEMAEYEHILDVIHGTAMVIERNPSTFAVADEPLIRDHFLVQLNGHYEGQATGETFNSHGKSDILVRVEDKNIFIAEIKFWDGSKSITTALIQLLTRYTTWRDSKIALIILNRRRDFSAVLGRIPDAIEACENVIRRLAMSRETDFRYLLRHPDDPNKELLLTVTCFEVPEKP